MQRATGGGTAPDHLVFVVHGVGDPKPADALTSLVDSYCAFTGAKPDGPRQSGSKLDSSGVTGSEDFIRTFPVHQGDTTRQAGDAIERTRFVEIYWGDLSRVKGSAAGLLLGTIDLLFGLRHIVAASQAEIQFVLRESWLRLVAHPASAFASATQWLIRGPMVALNLFAAIVVGLFIMDASIRLPSTTVAAASAAMAAGLSPHAQRAATGSHPWCAGVPSASIGPAETLYCGDGGMGIILSAAVALVLGCVMAFVARSHRWSASAAVCLAVTGVLCLGWAFWSGVATLTYAQFIEDLTGVLSLGAALAGLLVVLMLLLSSAALVLTWLFRQGDAGALRQAFTVVNVCTVLSATLFVLLAMVAWGAFSDRVEIPVLATRIEHGLHLFILVWSTFLLIVLAYGGISFRTWLNKRRYERKTESRFPRYIIDRSVVAVILGSALAWPLVFVPMIVTLECEKDQRLWASLKICEALGSEFSSASAWILERAHAVDNYVSLAVMASIGAVFLLIAARTHFGTALDIVLDVVSHFSLSRPPLRRASAHAPPAAPNDGGTVQFHYFRLVQDAIWQTIVNRFCVVVEDVLAGVHAQRVSVFAHSQGTMIALEALGAITIERKGAGASSARRVRLPEGCGPVALVTLGCPLDHLYGHYFPRKYRISAAGEHLLQRWINIYRVDDFVGREVRNESDANHPRNIPVGPRGHVDYWSDREVLRHLVDPANKLL